MEGQFATHALLVEQQRRIKTLEAELAQTQLEVMRLRSQVNPSNNPPPPPHDPSVQHLHLIAATGLPTPLHLSRSETPPVSHPISVAAAAAAHVAAAAALPQIPSQSSAPSSTQPQLQQGVVATGGMQTVQTVAHQPQPPEEQKKASSRYWTADEHTRFLEGLEMYGQKDIKAISRHVGTRSATQVRTHAQKYYLRIERERAKAEQEGKPPPVVPGSNMNHDHKVVNGKHSSSGTSSLLINTPQGKRTQKGSSKHVLNGTHENAVCEAEGAAATREESVGKHEDGERQFGNGVADNEGSSNSQSGVGIGTGHEDENSLVGNLTNDSRARKERGMQQEGTRNGREQGTVKAEAIIDNHNGESGGVVCDSHMDSNRQSLTANNAHNAIPSNTIDSTNSSHVHTEGRSDLPMPQLPFSSQPFSQDTSDSGNVNDSGPLHAARLQSIPVQSVASDFAIVPQAKDDRVDALSAPHSESKAQHLSLKDSNSTHTMALADTHQITSENAPNVKEENELGEEASGGFGKRSSPQPTRRSPKKRMKKPSNLTTLPPSSSAALPLVSTSIPPPSLPRLNTLTGPTGLGGASSRPVESRLYNHVENSGSMSNIRALLRAPHEDQVPGPSSSRPPILRRNESSNSVLADLSKNVGVLSRSNSFISPSGKGVTRSNSILSLLSGLPTTMRESPSTDRLLMLDNGEDRVMATLKAMDTGTSGATTLQAGPSTPGQTPRTSMGDRSFSFSQLQHIGLDDLEDPSAVALALQEEQKWENG